MKKLFVFLFAMLLAVPLLAANEAGVTVEQYFVNLAVMAPAVVVITQVILSLWKTEKDQLVSWIVSVLLSATGWFFQLGMFEHLAWYWIFVYGLANGLIANGIFDISIVQMVLNMIPKKKDKEAENIL